MADKPKEQLLGKGEGKDAAAKPAAKPAAAPPRKRKTVYALWAHYMSYFSIVGESWEESFLLQSGSCLIEGTGLFCAVLLQQGFVAFFGPYKGQPTALAAGASALYAIRFVLSLCH